MNDHVRTCAVEDCARPPHARGWCGTHYARWQRLGTVTLPHQSPRACAACDRQVYALGYCLTHYKRMASRGTVDDPRPTLAQRLEARTRVLKGGCWLWTGAIRNGYGAISIGNRLQYAHRASYELHVGPIPDGLTIDHLCRVRECINPNHLEPVTRAENTRREAAARMEIAG